MDNLKLLLKLGMSEYEARAYLALAKLGPSTVRDIVEESKLPRNKTYESLQKLENKNKVESLPLSPKKYRISNPETFKQEIETMNNSMDSLIKLIQEPRSNEFSDMFWIIKSKKSISEKMANQNYKCEKEIIGSHRFSQIQYKNLKALRDATQRGVKMKFITIFDKNKIVQYKKYLETGIEIRVWNEKKFGTNIQRMTSFDNQCARITIGKPEIKNSENYITIWSESKSFTNMIKNNLKRMWEDCEPIEKYL